MHASPVMQSASVAQPQVLPAQSKVPQFRQAAPHASGFVVLGVQFPPQQEVPVPQVPGVVPMQRVEQLSVAGSQVGSVGSSVQFALVRHSVHASVERLQYGVAPEQPPQAWPPVPHWPVTWSA